MYTINQNEIAMSICNQLQTQNPVLDDTLKEAIHNHLIVDYISLKKLSLKLTFLLRDSTATKSSQMLNMLAKAIGSKNHHSLKTEFEQTKQKQNYTIDHNEDSALLKFYKVKDELFSKFITQEYEIIYNPTSANAGFNLLYTRDSMATQEKRDLNDFLKNSGLKVSKNSINLTKIPYKKLQTAALCIVHEYKEFFTPTWKEENNGGYSNCSDTWQILQYKNISATRGLILVDDYSTDMFHHVIIDFLKYVVKFGELKDALFLKNLLNNMPKDIKDIKINQYAPEVTQLQNIARFKEYELKKNFVSKFKSFGNEKIGSTLLQLAYVIPASKFATPTLLSFANNNDEAIREIIIELCEDYMSRPYKIEELRKAIWQKFSKTEYMPSSNRNTDFLQTIDYIIDIATGFSVMHKEILRKSGVPSNNMYSGEPINYNDDVDHFQLSSSLMSDTSNKI